MTSAPRRASPAPVQGIRHAGQRMPLPSASAPSPQPGIWKLVLLPESPAHLHLIPSPPGLPGGYFTLAPGDLFTMWALPLSSQLSGVLGPLRGKAELLHWVPGTCDCRFTFFLPPHPPPCPAPSCPSFSLFPTSLSPRVHIPLGTPPLPSTPHLHSSLLISHPSPRPLHSTFTFLILLEGSVSLPATYYWLDSVHYLFGFCFSVSSWECQV